MRPQIFHIAGGNFHQHFLGDSEIWWIFQISSKLRQFFKKKRLPHEIRDLRTGNPGAKKFLNFLKHRFLASESTLELFMTHCGICDICKLIEKIWNY